MKIAIIDYKAGNTQSVQNALNRLGYTAELTATPEKIKAADKVIFPGVGNAGAAMKSLVEAGLDDVLRKLDQPVLGICLGMQLLCSSSEEDNTPGLGIIDAAVRKFIPANGMKVPHMGWNNVVFTYGKTRSEEAETYVYYVHSYYMELNSFTTAITEYTVPFTAMLQKDNFYGMQFHPEKSGVSGELLLKKFLEL